MTEQNEQEQNKHFDLEALVSVEGGRLGVKATEVMLVGILQAAKDIIERAEGGLKWREIIGLVFDDSFRSAMTTVSESLNQSMDEMKELDLDDIDDLNSAVIDGVRDFLVFLQQRANES